MTSSEALFFDAAQAQNMPGLRVLRNVQVVQDGSGRRLAQAQALYAEALEVFRLEVAQEALAGRVFAESPVLQLVGEGLGAESGLESRQGAPHEQHFLGGKVVQQLVYVFFLALGEEEFAGGDVQ